MSLTKASNSLIEQINAAIQSHNPFLERGAVVRGQDIWGKGFPDVSGLNAHASDTVFQAIKQVRSGQGKVTSIAITAEQGVGKSHIISRIRHRIQAQDGALFIYASAARFNDLNLIKYQFLQVLSESLSQIGSKGVKQWQELATAMVNAATKQKISPQEMILAKFPSAYAKNPKLLDHLTEAVLKTKLAIDPDIVRAILWTLSGNNTAYAIKWLSGNDLAEEKASELGLPNLDKEAREAKAFISVLNILNLVSDYNSLLICFDELEVINLQDPALSKENVVVELVKNLFDSINLSNSSQGIVLLTVMLPDTWEFKVKSLSGGSLRYRVSAFTQEPIALNTINGESILNLVSLWLKEFYNSKKLIPPHPVYPFVENQLTELAKQKPTVRQVLHWCANNFQIKTKPVSLVNVSDPAPNLKNSVTFAFQKELESVDKNIETLIEDKAAIANALRLAFSLIIGQTIKNVEIKQIEDVDPKNENKAYIDFKIICTENSKKVKIGVAVLQYSNANSVLAGLNRLIAYRTFGITRGCLVRSKEISRTATKAQECLNKLQSSKWGGKWVLLETNAIKPLLAIHAIYISRADYNLSEQQIFEFINQKRLITENYLIREILHNASEPDPKPDPDPQPILPQHLAWISTITSLGDRSIEQDEKKSNYQAGTDFENIVRRSLEFLGFTVDETYKGGAGGLDLFCSKPYPLVGECKAGKGIPSRTAEELIKLGGMRLDEIQFQKAAKLVIGPGKPSTDVLTAAQKFKISIINAISLQKLVELQAKFPGSVNLIELKKYLEPGQIDIKIDGFIEKVEFSIKLRSHLINLVKNYLQNTGLETVGVEALHGAYFGSHPPQPLTTEEMNEILIELSSPLTGYLGRIKGNDAKSDRFYYLRDLPIAHS